MASSGTGGRKAQSASVPEYVKYVAVQDGHRWQYFYALGNTGFTA